MPEDQHTTAGPDATQCGIHASADAPSPPSVATRPALDSVDPAALEREILCATQLMHSFHHRLIKALTAYDDTRHWAFSGARTRAHSVADRLGIHVGTGREWLRIGHAP